MYVLLAIILLAILIVAHEAGHFWAARLTGIQVREFSVGMGPRILGRKSRKYETEFSLRAIPMGGYCAFYGENDTKDGGRSDHRSFPNQKLWKRMVTILMGPGMNFILAFVVATVFFLVGGVNVATGVDPYISDITAAGPAYAAGIRPGDVVTEINGMNMLDGTMDTLLDTIAAWQEGDPPMEMTLLRDGETVHVSVTPVYDEAEQRMRIGVMVGGTLRVQREKVGPGGAISSAWRLCVDASGAILRALKDLVTTGQGLDETAGPVGIVSMVSDEVRAGGAGAFIQLLALISINLGLMNLLPIPGLDGSRLLFGLIELIRGKPVPPEKEAMVHTVGMVFLFGVLVFFTFRDILRLFR